MSEHHAILTHEDLITGLSLHAGQTLADAEGLMAMVNSAASHRILGSISFVPEAIPLLESSASSQLIGHLPLSDLKEWADVHSPDTPLSQLATTHRSPVRIQESFLTICRHFLLSRMHHLSVVDRHGNYLGEIDRNTCFEKLASGIGIGDEISTGLTFLLLETEKTGADCFDEIYETARAEGIRLSGYLELAPSSEEEMTSQTILLKLPAAYAHSFSETLRRMGYFNISENGMTSGSDELSRKAEEFLHFLEL